MATISLAFSLLSIVALCILILKDGVSHFGKAPSWRGLALAVAIVNSLLLVLVTELLGAFGRLEFGWVLALWALLAAVQIPFWRRIVRALRATRAPSVPLTGIEIALIVPVVAIVLVTAVLALGSAPNTYDALTYHLSRVAHWKQNGSVAFFPSWNDLQLTFPPFAEYALLNLQILTGGDRLAALVQWLSFVGALVGVSCIAAELGARRLGQLVALLFAATLPVAILQASSTQNDLVVSFWLVCFCYFGLRFVRGPSRFDAACAGAALGLALLTKATAYLLVPGFVIGFLILALRRHGTRLLPLITGGLILALGVPAAFYVRNAQSFGEPIGSPGNIAGHLTGVSRGVPLVSNLIRGVALHASAPPARFRMPERAKTIVERIEHLVAGSRLRRPMPADPWSYTMSREDRAGAPWHLLIVLVVLGALGARRRAWEVPPAVPWLVIGLALGVLMLSALIRWNVYMVRFHMSLFLLAAPLVGLLALRIKSSLILGAVSGLLVIGSVHPLIRNSLRPLLGPGSIFHTSRRQEYLAPLSGAKRVEMLGALDYLGARRDSVIGLRLIKTTPEYLFWILLPEVAAGRTRLCHVNVLNGSRTLRTERECLPSAVLADEAAEAVLTVGGVEYTRVWQTGGVGVYLPAR